MAEGFQGEVSGAPAAGIRVVVAVEAIPTGNFPRLSRGFKLGAGFLVVCKRGTTPEPARDVEAERSYLIQ